MRHYVDYCVGLGASSKQQKTEQGNGGDATGRLGHRLNAESILANALICPFCTFFGPAPSSESPSLPALPPLLRSVVLVEASILCPVGRSEIVSSLFSLVAPVVCLLFLVPFPFPRFRWGGGGPKISPAGLGCICLGISFNSHGTPVMTMWRGVCQPGSKQEVYHNTRTFDIRRRDIATSVVVLPTIDAILASVRIPPTSTRHGRRNCRGTIVTIPRERRG